MKNQPHASVLRTQAVRRVAKKIGRKIKSLVTPPPLVLCYHRIFQPETDPHLLSVSAPRFRQQLEVVRRIAQPLRLDQLRDALDGKMLPRRGVVITFDDGYLDNLESALPILRAANIPATIYIATGYVGREREFWWDELERLTLTSGKLPQILRLQVDGRAFAWNLAGDDSSHPRWNVLQEPDERTPRQRLFCELHAALKPLPPSRQEEVLKQLRSITSTPVAARPFYRCLNAAELKTLAAEPLITLGAHTISHRDLAACPPTEQEIEIAGSKRQLEEFIDQPVAHFSYPYGSSDAKSAAFCAASDFRSAVTCVAEPVKRTSHPHRLPRFLVRDWDGATFERQLRDFFRG